MISRKETGRETTVHALKLYNVPTETVLQHFMIKFFLLLSIALFLSCFLSLLSLANASELHKFQSNGCWVKSTVVSITKPSKRYPLLALVPSLNIPLPCQ